MDTLKLGAVARAGFSDLSLARQQLEQLSFVCNLSAAELLDCFQLAANPDQALKFATALQQQQQQVFAEYTVDQWRNLALLLGASGGLCEFYLRQPQHLRAVLASSGRVLSVTEYKQELLAAVQDPASCTVSSSTGASDFCTVITGMAGWVNLRVRYRQLLAELMLYDLTQSRAGNTPELFTTVSAALADLADAALETALLIARATLSVGGNGGIPIQPEHARRAPLAIIAMGKTGARELNVVSDVDVMFITALRDDVPDLQQDTLLRVATRLASETMRVIQAPAVEPGLWEVDANLRPEGKKGPLVRTLESYCNYYDKWAQAWEFQALLKARPAAGDLQLGQEFIAAITPAVWDSRNRTDFVASVQRMRERVAENLDVHTAPRQIKLGPGGLRDIEFSVQLLQLVHGAHDENLRVSSTLDGLEVLQKGGYIARTDADELKLAYVQLRAFEHRLQLAKLQRTALMPTDQEELRVLARACGINSADELVTLWEDIKKLVRRLHIKIFYAPLLSAVASIPLAELALTSEAAQQRLGSIGFKDPAGALRHLKSLTSGSSRKAQIQRNLLPVLIQWLGEGASPDAGLLAFRRISEANAENPWYLRLLRDGTEAAERLMRVLAGSRMVQDLLEQMPDAVAWLEENRKLQPAPLDQLTAEMLAVAARKSTISEVAEALRQIHKREVLRLALGQLCGVNDAKAVAGGLDAVYTAFLNTLLAQLCERDSAAQGIRFALIAMGRYGGCELGFASDVDVIAVYAADADSENPGTDAVHIITRLKQLAADYFYGVELDFDLRPEGKNGVLVRNLEGYRNYYANWSLTWESQALLRARFVAGDKNLGKNFIELSNTVRYPVEFNETQLREMRLLKARMETERLPRGAQPRRHLKLGPGGVSDTEWLVQKIQLQYAAEYPQLRTTSTLAALAAAVRLQLLVAADAQILSHSWRLASKLRSAQMLWSGRSTDQLPADRVELDGIGRILGRPPATTTELEQDWFAAARKSRQVFERLFYER